MKFKKFFASVISAAMILSCVVFPAHAESKTVSTEDEFISALKAAKNGDIVTLGADINYTGTGSITVPEGVTVDGDKHKVTVKDITEYDSGGLFYGNKFYTVKNITLEKTENSATIAIDMRNGGLAENVTVTGGFGKGVFCGSNTTVKNCTFSNTGEDSSYGSYGVYMDNQSASDAVIEGNTFNTQRAAMLTGSAVFKNNTTGEACIKGVSVNCTVSSVISGNTFNGTRALSLTAIGESTISGNAINGCVETGVSADLSGNYWGGSEPTDANIIVENADAEVTVNSYYTNYTETENGFELSEQVSKGFDGEHINSLEDLKAFRDDVNNGNDYYKKTVTLNANIDLKSIEDWTPIGNSEKKFRGTFDGNNKTISNLVIKGNNSNIGLFGYTTDGEIKNLTVNNADVSGYLEVGVVAGTPYTSKYTNIKVTGNVKVEGFSYVGGVGGKNAYANWTDITVDVNPDSYVKATSTDANGTAYRTYVGGVVGFNGEGSHTFKDITSNIDVIGDVCDIGGIFGIAHYGNNFEDIICTGNVTNNVSKENDGEDAAADVLETGLIAGVWHNGKGSTVTFKNISATGTISTPNMPGVTFANGGLIGSAYSANNQTAETSGSLMIDGKEAWVKSGDIQVAYFNVNYNNKGLHGISGEAVDVIGTESFKVELYSGNTLIGTSELVDPNKALLNGEKKKISWHILLDAESDGDTWWKTSWVEGAMKADKLPDKVKLYVDNVPVSEGEVKKYNADNSYPVMAIVSDRDKNVTSFIAADGYENKPKNVTEKFNNAIDAANSGDTITLLRDVELDAPITIKKNITIDGNGHSITQSAECKNNIALLYFEGSENNVLDITVKNATFDGLKVGAAVRTLYANMTIDHCIFQNCEHTVDQGLVRLTYGTANIKNSKFLNNNCSMGISFNWDGNGLATDTLTIDNCEFDGNTANKTALVYYVKGAGCEIKNSRFKNNTVNCNDNGATIYLGFQKNCVVTGNLFESNSVTDTSNSTRVGGALFFGYKATVSGNAFINNKASNANGNALGNDVCTSVYYGDIELGENYWGGKKPENGVNYFVQHTDVSTRGEATLDSYYKTYTENTDGTFTLSDSMENKLPNAEVKNLGSITVKNNEGNYKFDGSYYVYDLIGSSGLSSSSEPFDMQIAMEFIAKDTAEEASKNAYGNYTTDFFIKITGLKNGSFVGDGCYLAGYYPSFDNWVKIPLDGFTVQDGVVYPVISSAGFDFKYVDICSSVQDFICGIYLTEDIIDANPDIKVQLDLGLSETFEAAQKAEFVTVDSYEYDKADLEHGIFGIGFYVVNMEPADENTYRVGLFAGIDSLMYQEVGFRVYHNGEFVASKSTRNVYKKITASNGSITADDPQIDVFRLFGIPVDFDRGWDDDPGFQFQPYAIDLLGNTIDGRLYDIYDIYTLDEKEDI